MPSLSVQGENPGSLGVSQVVGPVGLRLEKGPSPLNLRTCQSDKVYLLEGFRLGFHIPFEGP